MEDNNIEDIIESVIHIVWNEIKYKAELKKEYGNIPVLRCNAQKLGQVFINLLVNAVQAINKKGIITIKTYKDNDHACIEFSDTGSGISQENIQKIFDPFFTTKPVGKGTGLGLSIGYDIVKQHNGELFVDSELNKGTKFTIKLPY
jgi:two-component system NtrC family sensor kinase